MFLPLWCSHLLILVFFALIGDVFAKTFATTWRPGAAIIAMICFIAANVAWLMALRVVAN